VSDPEARSALATEGGHVGCAMIALRRRHPREARQAILALVQEAAATARTAEEETSTPAPAPIDTDREEKPAKSPEIDGGTHAGTKAAEASHGAVITKYAWSDGKKTVSIYIELKDLDTLADEAITASSGEKEAALTIVGLGAGQQKLHLRLNGLSDEITGATVTRKKGKDTVVLKLQKKTEAPWHELLTSEGPKTASTSSRAEIRPEPQGPTP